MSGDYVLPPWLRGQRCAARVLVIEPELNTAHRLATALAQAGFDTACVHDGRMATEAAARLAPTVIVAEVNLPRLGGAPLIAALRRQAACADTPIVGLSAPGDRDRAMQAGFSRVLTRPVQVGVLIWTLWRLLDRRRTDLPRAGPERRAPPERAGPAPQSALATMRA